MMDQTNWVAKLKSAATEQACADADAELARSLVKSRAAMSTDPNVQMSALLVEELTGCRTFLHQLRDANMLSQAAECLQAELGCTWAEATEILERFMKGGVEMNEHSFEGVVLMNSEGLYLQIRERDAHTGHHVDITTTPNIDEVDVFRPGHLLHLHRQQDLSEYRRIPARVVNKRTVTRL